MEKRCRSTKSSLPVVSGVYYLFKLTKRLTTEFIDITPFYNLLYTCLCIVVTTMATIESYSRHHLQIPIPQVTKNSSRVSVESGYESRQISNAQLLCGMREEDTSLFTNHDHPLDLLNTNGEESTRSKVSLVLSKSPSCQDIRRGSDESSHQSGASTPGSTKPLLEVEPRARGKSSNQGYHLQIPKAIHPKKSESSDTQPKTYADEVILRETVRCEMTKFVTLTDLNTLSSHLFEKKIIHSTDYSMLKSIPTHRERGNHFYMDILPRKGRRTYRGLFECLKDETEHLGHRELLDILVKSLKDRQPPQVSADSSPSENYSVYFSKPDTQAQNRCRVCCSVQ